LYQQITNKMWKTLYNSNDKTIFGF